MAQDDPDSKTSAETKYVVGAYIAVGIAIVIAILLAEKNEVTIGISEGFAPFAIIYIVAQAVERLIQPFTSLTFKAGDKTTEKVALAKARETDDKVEAKRKLDIIQADRAVVFWAVATVLALLIAGALELGLIQSIAHVTGDSEEVPKWFNDIDIVLTGIAIGSGTKPLHDLITVIQNAKQKTE